MQEFGKEKFCEILELIFDSQVVKKNRKNWCRTGFFLVNKKNELVRRQAELNLL